MDRTLYLTHACVCNFLRRVSRPRSSRWDYDPRTHCRPPRGVLLDGSHDEAFVRRRCSRLGVRSARGPAETPRTALTARVRSEDRGKSMAYGIVHHFKGATKEQYEASIAAVHPADGSLPAG